jgi:CxxC-x17-CxxC domain-containing protein
MAYGNDNKAISQASAKGKVKWFNATKGYGFITLDNGGDAFCHASALQATGHSDVQPGTTIVCDLADSQRGLQVVTVHSVDVSTAEAPSRGPRREFGGGGGYGGGGGDRAPREMFEVKCSQCGGKASVPFQPRGDKPVYCRDCFQSRGGGGGGGGSYR